MRDFYNEEQIENNDAVYLGAVAQTAIYGWHEQHNRDCDGWGDNEAIVRPITRILGLNESEMYFDYLNNWDDGIPVEVFDKITNLVKEHANEFLTAPYRQHPWEFCYPPAWMITEFEEFLIARG